LKFALSQCIVRQVGIGVRVLHCLAQLLEEFSIWCPPISACSVAGIELVRDSSNVVRSVPMRSDAMLIPYFYKRGDLIAKDGDKDKQKNDTVLQNIALVNAVCLQILEILQPRSSLAPENPHPETFYLYVGGRCAKHIAVSILFTLLGQSFCSLMKDIEAEVCISE